MADPLKIRALTEAAIRAATQGGEIADLGAWQQAMRQAITTGHTAATLVGAAERGVGGRIRAALARVVGTRALDRADRQRLERRLREQDKYLTAFTADIAAGRLSPAQIAARADLYAGATRATYSETRWANANLPAHPGDGSSECLINCNCSWVLRDDGYHWELGTAEHCPTCEARASQWRPYRGR